MEGPAATWDGIVRGLDNNAGLGRFAGPGAWNNMDLLVVGLSTFMITEPFCKLLFLSACCEQRGPAAGAC